MSLIELLFIDFVIVVKDACCGSSETLVLHGNHFTQ